MAWLGMGLFLGGHGRIFLGLRRSRPLTALLGSAAFIVGILAATAACVWPVMLRSTLNPAWSLDAFNASAGEHGLRVGLAWWLPAFVIVLGYFAMLFRINRGKVGLGGEGY
jgi:cytochrome d ubiquinol oxidase subunit II